MPKVLRKNSRLCGVGSANPPKHAPLRKNRGLHTALNLNLHHFSVVTRVLQVAGHGERWSNILLRVARQNLDATTHSQASRLVRFAG